LRKLRRSSQWSVYLGLLAFGVLAAFFVFARPQLLRSRFAREVEAYQRMQQPVGAAADTSDPWVQIQAALDRGDNREALSVAQSFVARVPGYHYSHACLGTVYIAMGDFTNAETAVARAVELYPCEEHEKALAAIRKRLARDKAK
jgi:Flp pilus assembly protein TadD